MLRLPSSKFSAAIIYFCIAITFFITLRSLWFGRGSDLSHPQDHSLPIERIDDNNRDLNPDKPALPEVYSHVHEQPSICQERLGLLYLDELRHSRASYCSPDSRSQLTCFHSRTDRSGRTDSFCIGQGAQLQHQRNKFGISCHLVEGRSIETSSPSVRLEDFPRYWYNTGPHTVMDLFVDLDMEEAEVPPPPEADPPGQREEQNFAILLKREGAENLWHSMMEIMSLSTTLDVLQMSPDDAANSGEPFLTPQDAENTQVIILDDAADGPYFELWHLFARKPTVRLSELVSLATVAGPTNVGNNLNIIIPLPGGANPVWQGDWEPNACEHSDILRAFAHRVLTHLDIRDDPPPPPPTTTTEAGSSSAATSGPGDPPKITVTFIDRRGTRKLVDIERHMRALEGRYPHASIRRVDLAGMPFREQVQLVRGSDVLAGVHGAGLTHGLWMRERSAVVEILPEGFMHKGFRNLAGALGHGYFSAHGVRPRPEDGGRGGGGPGSWQEEDVVLEEEKLFELMDVAVKSMYNRGRYNYDVM
jgi:EGF domain-specific O-GlcNAc transferase